MRHVRFRASRALVLGALFFPAVALAQPSAPATTAAPTTAAPASTPPAASTSPPPAAGSVVLAPRAQSRGLAVLAVGDGSLAAWPLARALYGRPGLRPAEVDEAHARVLAGEPPPAGAGKDLTDLAETRAAIHGDDAPSRQLLSSIATQFHVRGIVVVMPATDSPPQARVFVAESASFDAARYAPEAADAGAEADWAGAIVSLDRAYGISLAPAPTPAVAPAPSLATHALPDNKEKDATSRPFYASPWFWGAVGAAALGATALYFATRDNSPSQIHLQLQVPK